MEACQVLRWARCEELSTRREEEAPEMCEGSLQRVSPHYWEQIPRLARNDPASPRLRRARQGAAGPSLALRMTL